MLHCNVASQHAFSANSINAHMVSRSIDEPIEGMPPLKNGHDPQGLEATSGTARDGAELAPDIDEARQFLAILAPDETRFTFQTFDDDKERKKVNAERERKKAKAEGRKPRGTDPLAQTMEGTLEECWPGLVTLNRAGAGIFVAVHRTDLKGRRRDENITHIRGVIQDDDRGCDESKLPLDATVKVETSPGKFQRLWLAIEPWQADEAGRADYAAMMAAVVTKYGGDPNAKDAARVFRLPGFYHRKGAPHRVRIADASEARYSREELVKAFVPAGASSANDNVDAGRQRANAAIRLATTVRDMETRPLAAAADSGPKPESGGERPYSARAEMELRSALACLTVEAKDYALWFVYGLAIYRLGWSERGYAIWRDWASTWAGFCEDDCRAKWDGDIASTSQRESRKLTIATVYGAAKKRG